MNLLERLFPGPKSARPPPAARTEQERQEKERRSRRLEYRVKLLEARVTSLQDILIQDRGRDAGQE